VAQEITEVYDKSNVQALKKLTSEEVISMINVFLLAGFDTTANTLALTCYYLAKHPEIQERLRDEINLICVNGVKKIKSLKNCVIFRLLPTKSLTA
jgi:cytochrome P450